MSDIEIANLGFGYGLDEMSMNYENAILNNNTIVNSESVKKQLFDGDNVVIDRKNDHGLSNLNINKP